MLVFGAIRPYKGIHGVIASMPELRRRHPAARAGDRRARCWSAAEGEYREAIRRAGVDDAVLFRPGYVPADDVAAYFAAADVAVFNYRDITDSGSLRLACDLGTPVVATSVGSFREFLTDGVTARLVEPGHVGALRRGTRRRARATGARGAHGAGGARARDDGVVVGESAKATAELYETIVRGGA